MQNSPLIIGGIELTDFEVPQTVSFGGRQRLKVHSLAGGRRIIERLGSDDNDIQFRGIFSGSNAEARAQALDQLRISGETVWLTWMGFRRQVIVRTFIAVYHNPWWISYRTNCIVVNQVYVAYGNTAKIASAIASDMTVALLASGGTFPALGGLQALLSGNNALLPGTLPQAQAMTAIQSTLSGVVSQIALNSDAIMHPIACTDNAERLPGQFLAKVTCAGSLASAVIVKAYLGRVGISLMGGSA